MKILKDILNLSWDYVRTKNPEALRRDVEDLIAFSLGLKRLDIYVNFDRPVEERELVLIREGVKRLVNSEPLQYIEGVVSFYGCSIQVNPSVLIPRPETELICDHIVRELQKTELKGKVLLDLCTGSGCLGIAIKKAIQEEDFEVIVSDISTEALQVAYTNALKNNVKVTILEGDLFESLGSRKVDYLVCNPPYISNVEFETLDRSVKNFEPKLALVSGGTGLEMYEKIAKDLKKYVNKKAWFEIGASQGKSVTELFLSVQVKNVRVEKDLALHDRLVVVEL